MTHIAQGWRNRIGIVAQAVAESSRGMPLALAMFVACLVSWVIPIPLGRPSDAVAAPSAAFHFVLGIGLLFGIYYFGYRLVREDRHSISGPILIGAPLAIGIALLLAAPFTSSDIFFYIIGGHFFADFGLNPALVAPSAFPSDPFVLAWSGTDMHSPYGPLWTFLAGFVHRLAGAEIIPNVVAFKALGLASLLLVALVIWAYLRRVDPRRARLGIYLLLWNPLALWESAGAGHNGLFSIGAVALALLAISSPRWRFLALPLIVCGVLFKFVPAIFVPPVLVWQARSAGRSGRAWAGIGAGVLLTLLLVVVS